MSFPLSTTFRSLNFTAFRHAARVAFTLFGILCLNLPPALAQTACADLDLVLAIDASGSIDRQDFDLQQSGYANAFRSPQVQRALSAAGIVDIAVVLWGDAEMRAQIMPLQRLRNPQDAERFAHQIAGMPRLVTGNTGIGQGIEVALDLLDRPGHCATRRLINVSGDGRESQTPRPRHQMPLMMARQRAADLGITINGLAISVDDPGLTEWYRDKVITGPDAFVMEIAGFATFAEAIAQKLAREIRPQALSALTDGAGGSAGRWGKSDRERLN